MVFGATHACPTCMLRFAARPVCPHCGSPATSLATHEGRSTFLRRSRGGTGVGAALSLVSRWAPSRPWLTVAIGVACAMPALYAIVLQPTMLQQASVVSSPEHLGFEYDGLSERGFEILGIAAAGLFVAALSILAVVARRAVPVAPPKKLRFHDAGSPTDGEREEWTGIARLATVELESPLGGVPCLAFGLRGEIDGHAVSDADGGDFDVVLPSGEVLMVSLEHAVLLAHGDEETLGLAPNEAPEVEEFLAGRLGKRIHETCTLAETILARGDTVTLVGRARGTAIAAAPFREVPRGRVIGGEVDDPVVVRVVVRAGH